jgi:hypothetical protein
VVKGDRPGRATECEVTVGEVSARAVVVEYEPLEVP